MTGSLGVKTTIQMPLPAESGSAFNLRNAILASLRQTWRGLYRVQSGRSRPPWSNAGAARGIVAPIAYINHDGTKISKVLTKEGNIFRPYLLKTVAYDYEKEIRFVLATQREILRDNGGVLISINAASFIDGFRVSPHLQLEEQSIVKSMVRGLLKKSACGRQGAFSRAGLDQALQAIQRHAFYDAG